MTEKNIENKGNNEFMINIDQKQIQSFSFKNTLKELNDTKNIHEDFKNNILKKYPRLNILKTQLYLDGYSKIENIKSFLKDLTYLPQTTLEKIKKYKNKICISDRSVTAWPSNNDLTPPPRGRPSGSSRDNVGGIYRRGQKTVYVGRNKVNGNYVDDDNCMLHELGHMFNWESERPSQSTKFKLFHKLFYNKLRSYFQQGGPGGEAGCSEFFAESCYQFFKRGEQKFTKYYNTDLYNYMKKILI